MERRIIHVPEGIMHRVCGVCNGSGNQKCFRCDGVGTFYDKSTCYCCKGVGKITCNVDDDK